MSESSQGWGQDLVAAGGAHPSPGRSVLRYMPAHFEPSSICKDKRVISVAIRCAHLVRVLLHVITDSLESLAVAMSLKTN